MPGTLRRDARFDVWGCRGSRSYFPSRSRVGNSTSCYSLYCGDSLFVFDAGRGISALGQAMEADQQYRSVRRVHVFVTHAHLDHWEGLKDVAWFWWRNNGLAVTIYGTEEALDAIAHGFAHPSYVPLEVLATGTVATLSRDPLRAGEARTVDGATVDTFPLNHSSGAGKGRRRLDTIGYRVGIPGGPRVTYLLDHEPTPDTLEVEDRMLSGTDLAVYDAHFSCIREQQFGHGSQEHAANMARRHTHALVLAAHHGPMYADAALRQNFRGHARGLLNFRLAVEGRGFLWDAEARRFEPARSRAEVREAEAARTPI